MLIYQILSRKEYALSSQTSGAKQGKPRSRWDARTKPTVAPYVRWCERTEVNRLLLLDLRIF